MDEKQTAGIGKGTPGPGRPAGVPNKATRVIREAFLEAFDKLGGVDALVTWAARHDDNRGQFYGLLARLLPSEVRLDGALDCDFAGLLDGARKRAGAAPGDCDAR